MRKLQLKKKLPLRCVCPHCGAHYADELLVEVNQRFLQEGDTPPKEGMPGAPKPEDLPAKSEEEAHKLASIALRQECELLLRQVNERLEIEDIRPLGEGLCPECHRRPGWVFRQKCGLAGAIAGAVVGLLITAALCVFWLRRPDIIIAIGLTGCLGYAGNRLAVRLENRRVRRFIRKCGKETLPKIATGEEA